LEITRQHLPDWGVLDVFVVHPGRWLDPLQLIILRHLEPGPGVNQEWMHRGGVRVEGLQLLPCEFQVQDVGVDGVIFPRFGALGVGRQPDGLAQWQVGKNFRRDEGAFPGHQVKVIAVTFHLVTRRLPDLAVLWKTFSVAELQAAKWKKGERSLLDNTPHQEFVAHDTGLKIILHPYASP